MAASSLLDVCRFTPTLGGTTDWTYSAAVTGYQSPSAAGVVNGAQYSYRAESADLSQWEVGTGTYNTSTGVLSRTTVLFNSSGTTSKISFTVAPQVAIVALNEDFSVRLAAAKSDQTTATSNSVAVTPGTQQYHDSAIKAFVNFTGSSGAINGTAYNVSSVTRTSAGIYVVNFATAFANTDFVATVSTVHSASVLIASVNPSVKSTSTQGVVCYTAGGTFTDPSSYNVIVAGRQ